MCIINIIIIWDIVIYILYLCVYIGIILYWYYYVGYGMQGQQRSNLNAVILTS